MAYRDDIKIVHDMGSGHYDIEHGVEPIEKGDTFDTARGETRRVGKVLVTWPRIRRATIRTYEAPEPVKCAPWCFMEE